MKLSEKQIKKTIERNTLENYTEGSTTAEWGLLGDQIKDAFDEIMVNPKTNQIKFLTHLVDINNGKIKL